MSENNEKSAKVHQIPPRNKDGFRKHKKITRIQQLEQSIKKLSALPQFLLQRFQDLTKVVQDLRFTYEVLGRILQDKGIVSQEEVTAMGNKIVEEQRKENEEKMKLLKEETEKKNTEAREKIGGTIPGEVVETLSKEQVKKELKTDVSDDAVKEDVSRKLMHSRDDLQKEQLQSVDVSIKGSDIDNA